jgi:hypothetical protein
VNLILNLGNVDRRVLYLLLAAVLLVPLVKPIGLPISISSWTTKVYDRIEQLKPGDRVIMDFNYGVDSRSDVEAQAVAILKHLAKKNVGVIAIAFTPQGPMVADNVLKEFEKLGKVYGKDYCNLGYLAGGETAMGGFIRDIPKACPSDFRRNPVSSLPIMQGITSGKDVQMLIYFTSGYTAEWIRQAGPLGVPIIGGVITVLGPAQEAFTQSGQLAGLLVGMRCGAEYELMLKEPGAAVAAMDAQSMGHLLFIIFIIFGNIAFLAQRKKPGRTG